MNYNQSSFRVDRTDYLKGNNSYEDYPDGGVTAETVGMNAWSKPGLIACSPVLGTSKNASLPDEGVIAWGSGKNGIGLESMAVVTNGSEDGSFYRISESDGIFTLVGTADTSQNYRIGFTDVAFYQGSFYTTSKTDIIKHSSDLSSRDLTYWSVTKGQGSMTSFSPHPMAVFGDILYIADTNFIHQLDGSTATADVFDLGTDWVVTAMTVYNNLIYIAAEPYWNGSGSRHNGAKIFTWNGYSPSWLDEWDVDFRVNALFVDRTGVMYVFNNHYMGYWTGSRVQYLRPVTDQVFKAQITSLTNSLVYADYNKIVRYGTPIFGGTKRFVATHETDRYFNGVASFYNNSLMVSEEGSVNSSNYFIPNMDNPSTTSSNTMTFNKRRFSRPVKVRGAVIDSEKLISGQNYVIKYIDDKNNTKTIGSFVATDSTMLNKYTWAFDKVVDQNATRSIQPILESTGAGHVEGFDIIYGLAESKFNQ